MYPIIQSPRLSLLHSHSSLTSVTFTRSVESETKWMFPVDDRMMEMYNTVKRGAYGQGVRIKFESKRPITPQEIETAMLWLAR